MIYLVPLFSMICFKMYVITFTDACLLKLCRKKPKSKEPKAKKAKTEKGKKVKDPNKPKRPATAFFVFL